MSGGEDDDILDRDLDGSEPRAEPAPVYLIDASIYVFRAWHTMPDEFTDRDGWPTNAVQGFARFLLDVLERERPKHIAVAFDEGAMRRAARNVARIGDGVAHLLSGLQAIGAQTDRRALFAWWTFQRRGYPPRIARIALRHGVESQPHVADRPGQRAGHRGNLRANRPLR